jgi:hypothetical protein
VAKILDFFDPADVRGGLWRLIVLGLVSMTILRTIMNPSPVIFTIGEAGTGDYVSMIAMSALLIAIDAMLLVLLSWGNLRDWRDALGVAAMVGATHVVFPLLTFSLTAGAALFTSALNLPTVIAGGVQTAIFFIAFVFVAMHLREVHSAVRERDPEFFEPDAPVATWAGVKQIWPAVFAVSVDALMVGPAKVAFMARYSTLQFGFSFLFIGTIVFVLVFGSGIIVLVLKKFVKNHSSISERVHSLDWIGSLGLVAVFIHFSIFAFVYVLFTLAKVEWKMEWLLQTQTIWGSTTVIFSLYLIFGRIREIKEASRQRAGMAESITV